MNNTKSELEVTRAALDAAIAKHVRRNRRAPGLPLAQIPATWATEVRRLIAAGEFEWVDAPSVIPGRPNVTYIRRTS
jgi:cupin superfamily acireductone dioxygenase involved in methionine salvage